MQIQSKEQIIEALESAYHDLFEWLNHHDGQLFEKPEAPGKWSAGQHADHLVNSTTPLRKGLSMPKIALRTTFGVSNREERTFGAVVEKYQKALSSGDLKAFGRYLPKDIANDEKELLIQKLKSELDGLKEILEKKWDEKKMSKFILPHPILGKMTIREMMFFTVYHTRHHLRILQERY